MEPPAKKPMLEEKEIKPEEVSLDGFNIIKVLLNDPKSKRIHVHGKIIKFVSTFRKQCSAKETFAIEDHPNSKFCRISVIVEKRTLIVEKEHFT